MNAPRDRQRFGGRFVYVAAFLAAIGGLLFGYDTGVISGAILFIRQDFHLSGGAVGLVVSAVLWGAVAGAAGGGFLADRFGRRPVIAGAAALFAVGSLLTSLGAGLAALMAGRVVVGIAIGVASLIAPMYIAEIAPPRIRGSLVAFNQLALTLGIVLSYLVDYALAGAGAWRWMFGIAILPAAVLGVGIALVPESPRWLVQHGQVERALSVLRRLRDPEQAAREVAEIGRSLQTQRGGLRELWAPVARPALQVAVVLAVIQQLTGINTVIYYAPTIFELAGFRSASSSILATSGIGVINVLFTLLAVLLLDRVGRRPLLLAGMAGMIASLALLALAFRHRGAGLGEIALAGLGCYVASFAVGLGPVFWLLLPEVFPLKVRGAGMSTATVANWGSNLVVALTFPNLAQAIGLSGTFWLYGGLGVAGWIFVLGMVPETKGKTLEEIEEHWRAGRHPREMGSSPDAAP